jgi:tetratricopeptide (TPR) repeat protein
MRQYPEAESNYLKAVASAELAKSSAIAVSTTTGNLIRLLDFYQENGREEDYLRFGERVVESLGDGDARLNHIRIAMGKNYLERGDLESAARHLEAVTDLLTSKPQADTTDLRDALVALSKLRSQQERFDEAEAALVRALDLAVAEDADGVDTGLMLNELAWFYVERDRAQEAVPRAQRAQEILVAGNARRVHQIAAADTLGTALHQLKRNDEALALYRGALEEESDESDPPPILFGLKDVYERFADVLLATGNRGEARRVKDRIRQSESQAAARDSMLEEIDRRAKQASSTSGDPASLAY